MKKLPINSRGALSVINWEFVIINISLPPHLLCEKYRRWPTNDRFSIKK